MPPGNFGLSFRMAFLHCFVLFKDFIYLFMRDTQREAETQAEGEAGSMQGARCGTRSRDPGSHPGPKADAQPLSHPGAPGFDSDEKCQCDSVM